MAGLPNISHALLERVFPRTLLALAAAGENGFAQDLARPEELARFPEGLLKRKWSSGRGFIPDLAALEYTLRITAMAPEIESRGFERVSFATEPDWYGARFRFDP